MKFSNLHRNIKIRLIIQFFVNLATMSILPFLAIYFSKQIGTSLTGLTIIIIAVAGVSGALIGGFYADKLGRKKMMIFSESIIAASFACITLLNSPHHDLPYITIGLFIVNFFALGMFLPSVQAMIIDVSTPESRKFIFGLSYWSNNLSNALGGVIGAFLFESYHYSLFFSVTIIVLLSLTTTIFFIEETAPLGHNLSEQTPTNSKSKSILGSYLSVFQDRTFILFITGFVLIISLEHQLTNYIGIRLADQFKASMIFSHSTFHFQLTGIKMLGFLRTENTLIVVALALIVGRIIHKFSDTKILYFGLFIYTIGYAVLGYSNSPVMLFVFMFILTIGELIYVPIMQSLLAEIPPENKRSSYMAVSELMEQVSMIIGALCITIGALLSSYEMSILFLLFGLTGIFILRLIMPELNKRREMKTEVNASNHTEQTLPS